MYSAKLNRGPSDHWNSDGETLTADFHIRIG